MKIYFVRHGNATRDYVANLTDLGISQINKTADFFKELKLDISKTRILSSELNRAVSSAKIIQEKLGLLEVEAVSWLTCNTEVDIREKMLEYFANNQGCENMIAVGHQPEIEKVTERFARNFGSIFESDPLNGSVHIINIDALIVSYIFNP